MATKVRLPQGQWYGEGELGLDFPDSWEVVLRPMEGEGLPPLGKEGMERAFAQPIASPPIKELARGKKEVAILFDDLSRPTRAVELVPYLLRELDEAGISPEDIRFVAALGAHGAHNRLDFCMKLGREIVEKFPVYNHNPYENCVKVGETKRGTPVFINKEVMACDLRIGVGCLLPHRLTGFGGGSKIMVPGVAGLETIVANHLAVGGRGPGRTLHPTLAMGRSQENIMRLDIEEAAKMAGLHFKIDVVGNKGKTVGLFLGEPVAEHAEGVKFAEKVYRTEPVEDADIVVANVYAKGSEAAIAAWLEVGSKKMVDLVVIANVPQGQVVHYLARSFGKAIGGPLWEPRASLPPQVQRLIVLSSYPEKAARDWFGPPDSTLWVKSWPEVINLLRATHGQRAKVAIYPDRMAQYFPS